MTPAHHREESKAIPPTCPLKSGRVPFSGISVWAGRHTLKLCLEMPPPPNYVKGEVFCSQFLCSAK